MWPPFVDLSKDECVRILRRLEVTAYSSVVSAFRAQGELTKERRKILSDLSNALNVGPERQKCEVRRAVNDEQLSTIARNVSGPNTENEWAREGRRIIPLLRRATPITAFTARADAVKQEVERRNSTMLPEPEKTSRKPAAASRRRSSAAKSSRGLMPPPAPPLSEMVDENTGIVRPPKLPVPMLMANQRANRKMVSLPEDVVILPSGMAVRFKEEPKSEEDAAMEADAATISDKDSAGKNKRKRRSANNAKEPPQAKGTIEILPYGTLMPPPMQPPPPPAHQQQLRHWQHLQHPNQPHPQQLKSGGGPAGPKRRRLSKKEQAAAKAMASMNAVGGGGVGSGVAASQIQSGHGYARQHFLPQVPSPMSELPNSGVLPQQHQQQQQQQQHQLQQQQQSLPLQPPPAHLASSSPVTAGSSLPSPATPLAATSAAPSNAQATPTPPPQQVTLPKVPVALSPQKQLLLRQQTPVSSAPPSSTTTSTLAATSSSSSWASPKVSVSQTAPAVVVQSAASLQRVMSAASVATSKSLPTAAAVIQQQQPKSPSTTTIQLKDAPAGMKMIPAGATAARILPKPGSGSASLPSVSSPVYMVATSSAGALGGALGGGQNVMRVARAVTTSSAIASQTATVSGQRVVTVTSAALRGHGGALRAAPPGTIVRTLQPRSGVTGQMLRPSTPNRPSVIVVQRTPGSPVAGAGKAIVTSNPMMVAAAAAGGQKIIHTKTGKPMVIVSKPSPIMASPVGTVQANKSSQPPLIVFDLGQQHQHQQLLQQQQHQQQIAKEESDMKNNVLSDILKSTGIIEEERVPIVVPDSSTPPPLQSVVPAQGSSQKNNGKAVVEGSRGGAAVVQEAVLQDEFVADAPKTTAAADHPTNHSNSVSGTDDKSSNNVQKQNYETATTRTQVINDGVEQPETKISKEPSAMEIAAALKSKQKQTNSSPLPLFVSPQAAMPVVMKRDSLEAMGPVVGEELLEAAAEAAKENAACILESSRNSEVVAAGNSNSAAAAAARGGDVEGVDANSEEAASAALAGEKA